MQASSLRLLTPVTLILAALGCSFAAQGSLVMLSGEPLSPQHLEHLFAKGDCHEILDPETCGPQEFCSENPCEGQAQQMELPPGSGIMFWVKDCNRILTTSQEHLEFSWYEPVIEVNQSENYDWVWDEDAECYLKCTCETYCLDEGEPGMPLWVCQTSDSCTQTGNVTTYLVFEEGECPPSL